MHLEIRIFDVTDQAITTTFLSHHSNTLLIQHHFATPLHPTQNITLKLLIMKLSMTTIVLAALTTLGSTVNSYELGNSSELKWTGPDSKGNEVSLFGMAHEVIAQLKVLDPKWIPQVKSVARDLPINANFTGIHCCPVAGETFTPQNLTDVKGAIEQLLSLGGGDYMVPPPLNASVNTAACYSTSCYYGACIITCNDNPASAGIPVASIIGYGAEIMKQRSYDGQALCGQAFDAAQFDVIVDKFTGLPP